MAWSPNKSSDGIKVRVQKQFQKNQGTNQNNRFVSPRCVFPYKIAPDDGGNTGYILAVVKIKNEWTHVKINIDQESYLRQKERDAERKETYDNFTGSYIDNKMAKSFAIEADNETEKYFVIGLENATYDGVEKINDVEYKKMKTTRIIKVGPPDKYIEGFFTASSRWKKEENVAVVSTFEYWEPTTTAFTDEEAINKLGDHLDELKANNDAYRANPNGKVDMLPGLGFKFITTTVRKDKNEKGEEVLVRKIIDTTECMDLIFDEEEKTWGPLTREILVGLMEDYKDYVLNGDESVVTRMNVEPESIVLELATFQVYAASPQSKMFIIKDVNGWLPFARMTNTPFFNSTIDETPSVGKNLAYVGFIRIAEDKLTMSKDRTAPPIITKRSLCSGAYMGSISGNVLSFLRNGIDNSKYEIEEKLKVRYYTPEELKAIEERKKEKAVESGQQPTTLAKQTSLTPPANLNLSTPTSQNGEQKQDLSIDDIFNNNESSKGEEKPPVDLDFDDDVPF